MMHLEFGFLVCIFGLRVLCVYVNVFGFQGYMYNLRVLLTGCEGCIVMWLMRLWVLFLELLAGLTAYLVVLAVCGGNLW